MRSSTRLKTWRGEAGSGVPSFLKKSTRKNAVWGSQVRGRKVDKSIRARASGYPVCQPVRLTLSYRTSELSQPKITSQKPKPDSTAEKNFSSEMYLPQIGRASCRERV